MIHDLTHGFTCGFIIQFQSSLPHKIEPRNHPSMLEKSSVVDHMIASELSIGRIAGPFLLSPSSGNGGGYAVVPACDVVLPAAGIVHRLGSAHK